MAADYPVRPVGKEEFDPYYAVALHAFNAGQESEQHQRNDLAVFEPDRSLAAFDQDAIIATACAYSFELTVPGTVASAAGVSGVSVLPSYRRRGLLSALMRRQLADVRDRGEAIAVLWASEPGIYGRYGYGNASVQYRLTIDRDAGGLGPLAAAARRPDGLRLRIAEAPFPRAELAAVYDAVRPVRPGMFARDGRWWDNVLADPPEDRHGAAPMRALIAADGTGTLGYALYNVQSAWDDGIPAHVLSVSELMAVSPAAYAALWSDLLTRDLVATVKAYRRPPDDPLQQLLADRRRARPLQGDGLWVRLIDVPGALAQRRYACPVDLVIEVADDLVPANAGRWRLQSAGPGGPASCEPASAAADVTLPVAALGACYLGGTRLGEFAAAGLASQHTDGAIAALSAAMSWDPAPWCPMIF
ncbi:MAG TPA: GNAT family N-acetyltransferase [Streptosporangiaceae bacterium]|jgi:predicted acetyltransferase